MYHLDTVNTPSSVSRFRNTHQDSTVYSEFSVSEKAPAPVAAHVSIADIWIRENFSGVRER